MATQAQRKAKPTNWQGRLEGIHGHLAYGWAFNSQQPQARVVVEACLNGLPFGTVVADVARAGVSAINESCADVCHGFVIDLGQGKREGLLAARIANIDFVLSGSLQLGDSAAPPPPREALSLVFGDGGLRLHGWVIDPLQPTKQLTLSALIAGKPVAQSLANLEHPALRAQQLGKHGFVLDLPLILADGALHEVAVVDESGLPLTGSPVQVCCNLDPIQTLVPDGSEFSLLRNVLQSYQKFIPHSVGWDHYPGWAQQFPPDLPDSTAELPRVALVISGAADLIGVTVQSLQQQEGVEVQIFPRGRAKKAVGFEASLKAALASGAQWLACVRAGDTLPAHALTCATHQAGSAAIVYGDSETDLAGSLRPWFKPAWNYEYALASDYVLELMLMKRDLVEAVLSRSQSFPANAAALSWQVLAQLLAQLPAHAHPAIVHVPHVVYRYQTPLSESERLERHHAAAAALARLEPGAQLQPMAAQDQECCARRMVRLAHSVSADQVPQVSLIIPTRDQAAMLKQCIDSILQFTDYPNLEIIVVDNGSSESATHTYFRKLQKQGITVLPAPGVFNFARINNLAVAAAKGEVIGLINNDIQALHHGWLQEMLSHLIQPHVGAVGAKLLWPNQMVQHGGIVLGVGNVAAHYGNLLSDADWGDHGRNQLTMQVSGVTAACLLMRRADYLALGGMDEHAFPVAFNDVDLCLRLRARGQAIIWTPHAKLLHAESASRGQEDTPQKRARAQREIEQLRLRWGHVLLHDPAYHPSLNLDPHSHVFSGLALPPRRRAPRLADLVSNETREES